MIDQQRRKFLRTAGAAGAILAVGGVGTASAREGKNTGASGDMTIVDIAIANGFNVLAAAVTEAGLVETLSGNRQFTVFAPTDEAFNEAGITVDNVDELDDEFLLDVLLYHVTPGRRYSPSVVNAPKIRMLNGQFVDVDGTSLNGGQATLFDLDLVDIEASNGVVHVINGVLLP
ncbi:Uncaracterized surface protein containing fasciclin (FAS1) repeats [Halogranum gelatinilyticum]|uniref:Uncaracterized surface protein containing fasciclin (FAS1) repeats n=1 Tax=Halogranum gelatinilyticum TaxID=660521 RepID=A0A1G9UQT2_9EURY|nr:fasciclin domain-containing protein [Halogranum gelatinilyticum]SDM62250.1 Uncaracterized surface protein containing fasciclin (FAS1) repeats [Halogranum gelatinilyticum]